MFIEIKPNVILAKDAIESIEKDYQGHTFIRTKSGRILRSDLSYSEFQTMLVIINKA